MSLMRLLTNGKTLVDLKTSTTRYHMPGKNFLPKFGTVKDPFKTSAKNSPAPAPVVVTAARAKPSYTRPPKSSPVPLKETQRMPALSAKMKETKRLPFVASRHGVKPQNLSPGLWKKILGGLQATAAKLKPLAFWSRSKAPAKSAVPRFDKPVLQGELSLENIKVVRNDLQDSDLDVMPARSLATETNFKPALQSQMKPAPAVSQGALV